jgi:hypothetical protein
VAPAAVWLIAIPASDVSIRHGDSSMEQNGAMVAPGSHEGTTPMTRSQNVGRPDRLIRLALGLVLGAIFLGGLVVQPWSWVVAALAGIMLLTGAVGICPIYSVLRISTCPVRR